MDVQGVNKEAALNMDILACCRPNVATTSLAQSEK